MSEGTTKTQTRLIYLIGSPATGKSSIGTKLAADRSFAHVSLGDECRRRSGVEAINAAVKQKKLLPPTLVQDVLRQLYKEHPRLILDGFPRDMEQAGLMKREPDLVLCLDCPKETTWERYKARNIAGRDTDLEIFTKRFEQHLENIGGMYAHCHGAKADMLQADEVQSTTCLFDYIKLCSMLFCT